MPVVPDHRIDFYRDRAAYLYRGGDKAATLLVRADTLWTRRGGCLWWSRWSAPREILHGFLVTEEGGFDDFLIESRDLEDELGAWRVGRFAYRGELFRVRWLDATESQRVMDAFGLATDRP